MLAPSFFRVCAAFASFALATGDAMADQVRISNLSDITIPQWITGDAAIQQDIFICIYRTNTGPLNRTYGIRAQGDSQFRISNGTRRIPYTLTWNDGGAGNPGGGTTTPMVHNVKLTNRQNARINTDTPVNSSDCNGGAAPTARLRVEISIAAMDAASDGTYTGTITLIVSLT